MFIFHLFGILLVRGVVSGMTITEVLCHSMTEPPINSDEWLSIDGIRKKPVRITMTVKITTIKAVAKLRNNPVVCFMVYIVNSF